MNVDPGSGPIIVYRDAANSSSEGPAGPRSARWSDDKDYFRAREQVERAAAKAAVSRLARGVHQELAQIYGRLARQATRPAND
jgi:hypothetical protein